MNDILQEIKRLQAILERTIAEPRTTANDMNVMLLLDEMLALYEWHLKLEEEM